MGTYHSNYHETALAYRETTCSVLNLATSVSASSYTTDLLENKEPLVCCAQPRTMTCTCRHLAADTVPELYRYLLHDCEIIFQLRKKTPVVSYLLEDCLTLTYSMLCMKGRHLSVYFIYYLFYLFIILYKFYTNFYFYLKMSSFVYYQYTLYFNNHLKLTYLFSYQLLLLLFKHILYISFILAN